MQPQTTRRPVMDVAAPTRGPIQATVPRAVSQPTTPVVQAPPAPAPTPDIAEAHGPLTVKDAPAPAETPAQAAAAMPLPSEDTASKKSADKRQHIPKVNEQHTPMALITFTILAMLILAGLAVIVYVTSQSS